METRYGNKIINGSFNKPTKGKYSAILEFEVITPR